MNHGIAAVAITLLIAGGLCAAGRSEVADAVKQGNKSALRTLLQQKADVNAPQADGTTALQWAVRENDLEMTEMLLRAGAHPSEANQSGATPMLLASMNGNAAILERLIQAGADPNAPVSKTGDTALMMAARTGK
jgi:ankyrin repeat protein